MMFIKTENKTIIETYGLGPDDYFPGKHLDAATEGKEYFRVVESRSGPASVHSIDEKTFLRMSSMPQFPQIHPIPKEGFLYRKHRGSLIASLLTVWHFNTREELEAHIRETGDFYRSDKMTIDKYGPGLDERIGWNTYVVCMGGNAIGFTSGPVT